MWKPILAAGAILSTGAAAAQDVAGRPVPGGTGFQRPVTELGRDLVWFEQYLFVIITIITVFVVALLAILILRYNKKANPTPATFTHNAVLEVTWTVAPILILVSMIPFSLDLLYKQVDGDGRPADVTIKAVGYQWYWGYEYVDHEFAFDAVMLQRDELADEGYEDSDYLLATDTAMVVPVNKVVKILVTADPSGVIHAWTVPSFGVKIDGIPGRLNEIWFEATETGTFFGQCSELCGDNHAYMPITVKVVTDEEYAAWLEEAEAEYALNPTAPAATLVASAD